MPITRPNRTWLEQTRQNANSRPLNFGSRDQHCRLRRHCTYSCACATSYYGLPQITLARHALNYGRKMPKNLERIHFNCPLAIGAALIPCLRALPSSLAVALADIGWPGEGWRETD